MTNLIPIDNHAVNRPRLCRSDQQPNLLEYIDTTLNESFSLNLTLTRTISNEYDQFGNTILDQYLVYLLCQKLKPNRTDNLTDDFYHLLHQLINLNGKFSKGFFEYSGIDQTIFDSYTNFVWSEFDASVLLEIGCFLLKYRLRDIFMTNNSSTQQKIVGYFLEIIAIYYLSSNFSDYLRNSRSMDMIFPSPTLYSFSSYLTSKIDEKAIFEKFLQALHDNGEIIFDIRQIKFLLQNNLYQFINKKLENKKIDFIKFFEKNFISQQQNSCRSLKSICRSIIKMNVKQYPHDIKYLTLLPKINDQLQNFLIYQNQFAFESDV